MNYRHIFHAGNFADVFKHIVLVLLLEALHRKDTPFRYIETHAGAGRYDLTDEAARRTAESDPGIKRLWPPPATAPTELAPYFEAVSTVNGSSDTLRYYPGSPLIARRLLRAQDCMELCERHPEEHAKLKGEFIGDANVMVHERDGYEALPALVPPKERRGIVLIDPAYEEPTEQQQALEALRAAHRRWPTGVYALWYPIKDRAARTRLHRALQDAGIAKILIAELAVFPEDSGFRLNGCGLAIVNAPWAIDATLARAGAWLHAQLQPAGTGRAGVKWLVPE